MAIDDNNLVLCYNRGCGKSFNPEENSPESCIHHSGVPVFHDAYKGWSCCKKKCTDFTEFLNIKGCTISCHSNVKPPEPEKPKKELSKDEVIEYRAPLPPIPKDRPPFDTPLVTVKCEISDSLISQLTDIQRTVSEEKCGQTEPTSIPIGTNCKNNSCKGTYEGPESNSSRCIHHPGYPVFHEGLKFWSCCTKRTTDFNTFLEQVGCKIGDHVWFKTKVNEEAKCRLDWHQTGTHVYVTIYSKKSDPKNSSILLSPVRLKMSLYFPEQDAYYNRDLHLNGIVEVEKSNVHYFPSKVEIKLVKGEPGNWTKLDLPQPDSAERQTVNIESTKQQQVETLSDQVESVDLSCI